MRITGMYSGFDTDQMVKDLMKAESAKLDNVQRDKEYSEWEQEAFREVTKMLQEFQGKYFDYTNPETNLLSQATYSKFDTSVLLNGSSSSIVSVSGTGNITGFDHTISSITQLATKDTWNGTSTGLRGVKTSGVALSDLKTNGMEFNLSINSTAKTITVSSAELAGAGNMDDVANILNTKISESFGAEYNSVVSKVNISGNDELNFDMVGNSVKIIEPASGGQTLTDFGVISGTTNTSYKTNSVGELFGFTDADLANFTVNGVNKAYLSSTDTIDSMLSKINNSGAGIEVQYNDLTDKFVMTSTKEGSANDIELSNQETIDFFAGLGIQDNPATRESGKNALLNIDGVDVVQSSNTFTSNGIKYELHETYDGSSGDVSINLKTNTEDVIKNIKSFVEDYNNIITYVNNKLSEKRDYDYRPLTADEKEAMNEDDIKKWEAKAKTGILKGSSELTSLMTNLRQSIYNPGESVGISLSQIGITMSSSYTENGKLNVDEEKLKTSLETNFNDVVNLFTAESDKAYGDKANSAERYSENGIAQRFSDILKDNVRVTRDEDGYKGLLIEKAGIEGDLSNKNNSIQKIIDDYNDKISKLEDYLVEKEEYYYWTFGKMESALAEMESQSQSLASMLG